MKKTALLFLLIIPFLLPAKQKVIGYYDMDSVIASVPAFKRINDSLKDIREFLGSQREKLVDNMNMKIHDAGKDSASWSPIIKSLKLSEIVDMRINLQKFDEACEEEFKKLDLCFNQKITATIQSCLYELCNKKDYLIAFEKNQPNYTSDQCICKCITQEIAGMAMSYYHN